MLRDVVDVPHRRLNVRVSHVGLDVGQRKRLHSEGSECVPQVVESELLESRASKCSDVASSQGGAFEMIAHSVYEHQVVVAHPPVTLAQPVKCGPRLIYKRNRPDFA
jgi:hypothetical protein